MTLIIGNDVGMGNGNHSRTGYDFKINRNGARLRHVDVMDSPGYVDPKHEVDYLNESDSSDQCYNGSYRGIHEPIASSSSRRFKRQKMSMTRGMEIQAQDYQAVARNSKNIMWTSTMDNCLTDLLLEQVRLGRKIEKGFHKDAWAAVVSTFNARCGTRLSKEHCKNRLKTWKKIYLSVKALLDHEGFRWDDKRKMVYADDEVWDYYIKLHPEANKYRYKAVRRFNELALIMGNEVAEGIPLRTCAEMNRYNTTNPGLEDVDGMDPAGSEDPEHWADSMHESDHSDQGVDRSSDEEATEEEPTTSTSSKESKRLKRNVAKEISESLAEMASALRMLAETRGRIDRANKPSKMKILFDEVKKIPNIDKRFLLAACDFLASDNNRAELFLAIDENLRHEWLLMHIPKS